MLLQKMNMVTKRNEVPDIKDCHNDIYQEDSTSPYQKEWNSLFCSKYYLERLKSSAIKGELKNSHFRSICWKVFLECLPENRQMWIDTAKSKRQQYEEILDKFDTNPRSEESLDIKVNNPLSQCQQSPWNQYFEDSELKITIEQDVVRTFPEIEFFHRESVQKMMISILFSYAREFPNISYKQGMHELLAPILFVLHYDLEAYLHVSETDHLDLDIHIMLNQNYIEHDAFFLFCQLMEGVEAWYTSNDYPYEKNASLFTANCLGRKLRKIYEKLLKHHDTELFLWLEELEITPQIFGIRWLRLLFGREFSMHDLLIVWDAIFADSITFDLVDYIFVGMLNSIRHLLLQSDYASCLTHLMHFPNVVDACYIIGLALHLRDPEGFSIPTGPLIKVLNPLSLKIDSKRAASKGVHKMSSIISAKASNKVSINLNKNIEKRPKSLSIPFTSHLRPTSLLSSTVGKSFNESERKSPEEPTHQNEADISNIDFCDKSFLQNKESFTFPRTMIQNVMEEEDHVHEISEFSENQEQINDSQSNPKAFYREMVSLRPPPVSPSKECHSKDYRPSIKETASVKDLKAEIADLKLMKDYCTDQITQHLNKLQNAMISQKLLHEDEMYLALAGLKRARDILKGTVNFTEDVIGDDINPYSVITKYNDLNDYSSSENNGDQSQKNESGAGISTYLNSCGISLKLNEQDYVTQNKENIESVNCIVSNSQTLVPNVIDQDENNMISSATIEPLSCTSISLS